MTIRLGIEALTMFTNPQKMGGETSRQLRRDAGKWLKSLREGQGLVQREVGDYINYRHYTHYAAIESGVGRLSADRLHLVASVFGIDSKFLARKLMFYYDPDTFRMLFDPADVADDCVVLGAPMGEVRRMPTCTAEDAKRLRGQAGVYLRQRREAARLTQSDLAEALGYKFYTRISQIERGIGRVPPEDYGRYAEALGVEPRGFVKELLRFYDPLVHHLAFEPPIASHESSGIFT